MQLFHQKGVKSKNYVLVICFIFLLFTLTECQFVEMILSSTVSEVQQLSKYTFVLNLYAVMKIPAGTTIIIKFPIDYQSQTLKNYQCAQNTWTSNVNLVCTLEYRQLTVTGGFPNDVIQQDVFLQFSLINIKNPTASGESASFNALFIDSNQQKLAQTGAFGVATLTFTVGVLTFQTSISPTTVNKVSTLTVTVTAKHKIPKAGYLNLRLDTYWKTNIVNNTQIVSQSARCFPSQNVSSTIVCTISSGTSQLINLYVNQLFTEDYVGTFSFTIYPFLNAPTTAPQGSFELTSYNSQIQNKKIDTVPNHYISGFTPNLISSPKLTLISDTVGTVTQAQIQCYINNIISSTDTVGVQFPSQINLSELSEVTMQNNAVKNLLISATNLVTFTNLTLNSAGTVTMVFKNITLPDYSAQIGGFSIQTSRSSYQMDLINEPFTLKTTKGLITAKLTAYNYEVGVLTDYKLQITLGHAALASGSLQIEFSSSQYNFDASFNISCISSTKNGCLATIVNSNTLMFQSIFIDQTSSFILTIKNIKNSYKLGTTRTLIITSYKKVVSNWYPVDQTTQNDIVLNLVARKLPISQISITSNSNMTYQLCDLSISISNSNPLPMNSYAQITIPSQLILANSVNCNFACTKTDPSTIKVGLFNSYDIGKLDTIKIFNVRNSVSTAPTSSFAFQIYDSSNQVLEYRSLSDGGVTYQAVQSRIFSMSIDRSSKKNNDQPVTYNFIVSLPFDVTNGVFRIQIPITVECADSCIKSVLNSSYYMISEKVSTISNKLSLTKSFKNHYSFQPLTINAKYLTSDELYEYAKETTTVTNNQVSSLSLSLSWSNQQLASTGSMFLSSIILGGSYEGNLLILVNFGSDFDLTLVSSTFTINKTTNEIIIQTNTNQTSSKTIQLQNLKYPSSSLSLPIYILVKTGSNFLISKSSNLYWTIFCQLPCKTCALSNKSSCNSCYSDSSLVDGFINYHPLRNQCVRDCGTNYYLNATDHKCYQCYQKCLNCQNLNQCTSCNTGSYLLKSTSTCYQTICPPGYFNYYTQCSLCTSSLKCKTCTDSLTCNSCINGSYFHQSQCITDCPNDTTLQNSFTNNCDPCPQNCTKCTIGTDLLSKCFECQNGYYLDNGGCYQTCRTPGLVPDGNLCVICHQTCLTCKNNKYLCLTCNSTSQYKYFYTNACLVNCPNGFFKSQTIPFTCLPCTKPCEYCSNSSSSSCSTCIDTYSLYNSTCKSVCPETFYSQAQNCTPCIQPCKLCLKSNICLTCVQNHSLFEDQCVSNCDPGYVSVNQNCIKCSDNCKTCSAVNFCTSCFSSTYLYEGTCINPCPDKYFKNQTLLVCSSCKYDCKLCLNLTFCTFCQSGYQLGTNNLCVNTCDSGYIPVNGVCTKCSSNCKLCEQSINKCTQCLSNVYYVPSQFTCLQKCIPPLVHSNQNLTCLQKCVQPSYQKYVNQTFNSQIISFIYCTACPSFCSECSSDTICLSCINNTYKYKNLCYDECPTDAPTVYLGECRTCNIAGCFECTQDNCSQCQSNLLLIGNNLCITSCSSTQAYNASSKQCDIVIQSNSSNSSNTNSSQISNSTIPVSTSSTQLNFIPFPYLIVAVLIFFFILILSFSSGVLILPMLIAGCGICTMLCAITSVLVYIFSAQTSLFGLNAKSLFIVLILAGIAITILLNIIVTINFCLTVEQNKHKWSTLATLCIVFSGTFINLSVYQLFNSKLYRYVSITNPQNQPFWTLYDKIIRITLFNYIFFVAAGILLILSIKLSTYLYYSCIQLIILSISCIFCTIIKQVWSTDYLVSDSMSYDINDSFNKLDQFSVNQKDHFSELNSTTTIHARTQNSPNKRKNSSFSQEQINIKKTKSQFLFKNTADLNLNQMASNIKEAFQKGKFRPDYQKIIQKQLKDQQFAQLQSASKLNNKTSKVQAEQANLQKNQLGKNDKGQRQENQLQEKQINIFNLQQEQAELQIVDKPHSPSKSKRVSKQTQRGHSRQSKQQSSLGEVVEERNELTQKQHIFFNPNIIFIDEEAEQKQTKISEDQSKIFDRDDASRYKPQTNRSEKALLYEAPEDVQKQTTKNEEKINKQIKQKPKMRLIKDTQVEFQSSKSSHLSNYSLTGKEQHFQNIFLPKDDLQEQQEAPRQINRQIIHCDLETIKSAQSNQIFQTYQLKIQPNKPLYNTVNLDSQKTKKQKNKGISSKIKENEQKIKKGESGDFDKQQMSNTIDRNQAKINRKVIYFEQIQDFEQDNQRPSIMFKPTVKNALSNLYDEMPLGISVNEKNKNIKKKKGSKK